MKDKFNIKFTIICILSFTLIFKIYLDINIRPPIKTKKTVLNVIEKNILFSLRNIKTIRTGLVKEYKLSYFKKGEIFSSEKIRKKIRKKFLRL